MWGFCREKKAKRKSRKYEKGKTKNKKAKKNNGQLVRPIEIEGERERVYAGKTIRLIVA